jgi:hypothetical protein
MRKISYDFKAFLTVGFTLLLLQTCTQYDNNVAHACPTIATAIRIEFQVTKNSTSEVISDAAVTIQPRPDVTYTSMAAFEVLCNCNVTYIFTGLFRLEVSKAGYLPASLDFNVEPDACGNPRGPSPLKKNISLQTN